MHVYGQALFSNPMSYDFYFTFLPVYFTQEGGGQPQEKMCLNLENSKIHDASITDFCLYADC